MTTGGTFQYLTTVPANTTSYTDTGLIPSTFYDYHVQAINLAGYSDFAGISTTTLASTLPAPWKDQDVGTPAIAGGADYAAGVYTLTASGADIWTNADEFHFLYQALRGDGTITARVASFANPESYAKAGVMIRQTLDGASTDDFEGFSATQGIVSIHRDATGATSTNDGGPDEVAPYWVRLSRVGSVITASTSPDGVDWTVSSTVDIAMGANVFVGLAVASHDDTQTITATFDNVAVVQADYSQGVAVAVGATDPIGNFLADRWGEGGNTATTTDAINTSRAANSAPEAVYQSERYGNFSYVMPNLRPYGLYTVRLDESENYFPQAGSRQFDVEINGLTVLTNYDIFAAAGGKDIAVNPSFAAQADADGQIFVTFTNGADDNAKVDGLEILPRSAPAVATVTASASATTYGQAVRFVATVGASDANQPTPTGTVLFFVDGRQVDSEPLGADGTATSAALANLGAGTHSVTISYKGDSVFGATTSAAASLAVTPAPLRIVAGGASKVYGAADPSFSISTAGFVLGQGLADLAGSLVETSAATTASHVGTYAISAGGLTSANYAITFVPGTLTVTPAPLTITVANATSLVGGALPAFSASYVGLVAGDTPATLEPLVRLLTTATTSSPAGTYAITVAPVADPDYTVTARSGVLTLTNPTPTPAVLQPPADFDGSGRTDLAVYDAASGAFLYQPSSGGPVVTVPFGSAGAGQTIPAPGDYTAAGHAEIAAYLPSLGVYAIRPAGGGQDIIVPFGIAGAGQSLPAPGDYEGSGKDDIAVYMPAIGAFGIRPAAGGPDRIVPFGTAGVGQSLPAPADYFGTGQDDVAVYLAAIGAFAIRNPAGGPDEIIPFGRAGVGQSIPIPGDYDGSGHVELAVYMPTIGAFAYRPYNGGPDVIEAFGTANDGTVPIPGDYDGSGHDEIAVYDPNYAAFAYRPARGSADVIQLLGPTGTATGLPTTSLPAAAPAGAIPAMIQAISAPTSTPTVTAATVVVSPSTSVPAGPTTLHRGLRQPQIRLRVGVNHPVRPSQGAATHSDTRG